MRDSSETTRLANGFHNPDSEVECYLSSFVGLENLFEGDPALNVAHDRKFFSEFELTGLPGLLRVLLNGDFFVGRSR